MKKQAFISKIMIWMVTASMAVPWPVDAQVPSLSVVVSVPSSVVMKGLKIHPQDPLKLDFLFDQTDVQTASEQLQQEYLQLAKHFLAALTIPDGDLWVNLSPQEPDRVIPASLGQTDMGRELLEQDYALKRMTADLMNPDNSQGRDFWDKVYQTAYEKFGVTDIPLETFHRVWIVPEKAVLFQSADSAYVVDGHLKVMLDKDYLAEITGNGKRETGTEDVRYPLPVSRYQAEVTQTIRDVILPIIEKEVNDGPVFEPLRRIYNVLILAKWYKLAVGQQALGASYVDQKKTIGIEGLDPDAKEKVFAGYVELFTKGNQGIVQEAYDPVTQQIVPRQYFTGGIQPAVNAAMLQKTDAAAIQNRDINVVTVDLAAMNQSKNFEVDWNTVRENGFVIDGKKFMFSRQIKDSFYNFSADEYIGPGQEKIFVASKDQGPFIQFFIRNGSNMLGGMRPVFDSYPKIFEDQMSSHFLYGSIFLSDPIHNHSESNVSLFDFNSAYLVHYTNPEMSNLAEIFRFGLIPASMSGKGESLFPDVISASIIPADSIPQRNKLFMILDPEQGYQKFYQAGTWTFDASVQDLKGLRMGSTKQYAWPDEVHAGVEIAPVQFRGLIVNMEQAELEVFLSDWKDLLNDGYVFNLPIYSGATGTLVYDQRLETDGQFFLEAVKRNIDVYKFLESQKAQRDVGYEGAVPSWLEKNRNWLSQFQSNPAFKALNDSLTLGDINVVINLLESKDFAMMVQWVAAIQALGVTAKKKAEVGGIDLNQINLEFQGEALNSDAWKNNPVLQKPFAGLAPRISSVGHAKLFDVLAIH